MGRVLTLGESAAEAVEVYGTFRPGKPDLVPTGITAVDRAIGGMSPGSAGILAAATGVGKSSVLLVAANNVAKAGYQAGIISLEDPPDVFGSRALALYSGVNSLAIRRKNLTEGDKKRIATALQSLATCPLRISFEIGSGLPKVLAAVESAAKSGVRIIYVDYIQKIRGVTDDRRNEVATAFTQIQGAAAEHRVAVLFVSQFSRQPDPTKPPQIWWLKESGDLENEARLIVLMHRNRDGRLEGRIAKSTVGGEGTTFTLERDKSGTLREVVEVDDFGTDVEF